MAQTGPLCEAPAREAVGLAVIGVASAPLGLVGCLSSAAVSGPSDCARKPLAALGLGLAPASWPGLPPCQSPAQPPEGEGGPHQQREPADGLTRDAELSTTQGGTDIG